jgi:hypothetical protein
MPAEKYDFRKGKNPPSKPSCRYLKYTWIGMRRKVAKPRGSINLTARSYANSPGVLFLKAKKAAYPAMKKQACHKKVIQRCGHEEKRKYNRTINFPIDIGTSQGTEGQGGMVDDEREYNRDSQPVRPVLTTLIHIPY